MRVLSTAFLRIMPNGQLLTRIEDDGPSSYRNQEFEQHPDTTGNMDDHERVKGRLFRPFAGSGHGRASECLNCIFI